MSIYLTQNLCNLLDTFRCFIRRLNPKLGSTRVEVSTESSEPRVKSQYTNDV